MAEVCSLPPGLEFPPPPMAVFSSRVFDFPDFQDLPHQLSLSVALPSFIPFFFCLLQNGLISKVYKKWKSKMMVMRR
jgi:hypothetical protein